MDPDRFKQLEPRQPRDKTTLLFAGLTHEWMKGFDVLRAACRILWQRRQDFELVATGEEPPHAQAFERYLGWLRQEELARQLAEIDVLVMPTIAQEALGRTAVEAMAARRFR
jgi:glycosyltransferase involved in cell wall biosynthesis